MTGLYSWAPGRLGSQRMRPQEAGSRSLGQGSMAEAEQGRAHAEPDLSRISAGVPGHMLE